eukprot:jgi/Mesvir1/5665/Mv15683-RA.1
MDLFKMCMAAAITWWLTKNAHKEKLKSIKTETQIAGSILRLGEDSESESSGKSSPVVLSAKKSAIETDYVRRVAEDLNHTEVPNLLMLSATLLKLIKIQQETLSALKIKNRLMAERVGAAPSYVHSTPSMKDLAEGKQRATESLSVSIRSSFDEQENFGI